MARSLPLLGGREQVDYVSLSVSALFEGAAGLSYVRNSRGLSVRC